MIRFLSLLMAVSLSILTTEAASVEQTTAHWANILDAKAPTMGNSMVKTGNAIYYLSEATATVGDGGTGFPKEYTDPHATIYFNSDSICYGAPYQGSSYNHNLSVIKTDADGRFQWTVFSTSGETYANNGGITLAPDGGIYVAVKVRHTSNMPTQNLSITDATGKVSEIDWKLANATAPRYYQGLILKISDRGELLWTRTIQVSNAKQPAGNKEYTSDCFHIYDMKSDAAGNIYMSGRYCNPVTFHKADGTQLVLTPHNTEGWNGDSQNMVGDMYVAKFNADGYLTKVLTTTGKAKYETTPVLYQYGQDLILNAVFAGTGEHSSVSIDGHPIHFQGEQAGIYTARLSNDFELKWQHFFPGEGLNGKNCVFQYNNIHVSGDNLWLTGMGNFILNNDDKTASIKTTSSNVREGYIIKCNVHTGNWVKAQTSKAGFEAINGIVGYIGAFEDENDGVYVIGYNLTTKGGTLMFKHDKETLQGLGYETLISGGSQPTVQGFVTEGDFLYTMSRGKVYPSKPETHFGFINNEGLKIEPISPYFKAVFAAFQLPFRVKTDNGKMLGDINKDGVLNNDDVTTLLNVIAEQQPVNKDIADINKDGEINVSDVTSLINLILK